MNGEHPELDRSPTSTPGGIAVVLFTDLVDSTALLNRLGDQAMNDLQSAHLADVRRAVEAYGGVLHKTMGDGAMASFTSAVGALAAAATVARDIEALDERENNVTVAVRVGVSVGEPIARDGDLQGLAVVIAARLCAAAGKNELLIQDAVRALVEPRGGFDFEPGRSYELKGITTPVPAAALNWRSPNSDVGRSAERDGGIPQAGREAGGTGEDVSFARGGGSSPPSDRPRQISDRVSGPGSERRAGDRDREDVAERVRSAAAAGQLNYSELEDRLALIFAGRTMADLERVSADLGPASVPVRASARGEEVHRTISVFGSSSRRGVWSVGPRMRAVSVFGSATIDLTRARLGHPVTNMRVFVLWGAAAVRVPDGVAVQITKTTLAGRTSVRLGRDEAPVDAPLLQLRLVTVMGSIKVRRWHLTSGRPPARRRSRAG